MGHFLPGHSNSIVGNFVKEDRYSVVAALGINGIVATHMVATAFNTTSFDFFMEHFVCPHIGRFALNEPCEEHGGHYFIFTVSGMDKI